MKNKIIISVNQFYERFPYPSLPIHNEGDLTGKLHANIMSRILSTAGLHSHALEGKQVLDAGCGTGEKACYFSYYGANVIAIDISRASLRKAKELSEKFNLNIDFIQCDILDFNSKEQFDHIFCLGVLHHTSNPYLYFHKLASLCKKGGTITIGLYNKYGKLKHRIKNMWIQLYAGNNTDKALRYVERHIYKRKLKSMHEKVYVADKYANPHESYHSVGEVLKWLENNNITCIGIHPKMNNYSVLTQLKWLRAGKGFFIVSGRKN